MIYLIHIYLILIRKIVNKVKSIYFINLRICSTVIMSNTFVRTKGKCIIETVVKHWVFGLAGTKMKHNMTGYTFTC